MKVKTASRESHSKTIAKEIIKGIITLKLPLYWIKLMSFYGLNCCILPSKIKRGVNCKIMPTVFIRNPKNVIIGNNFYANHNVNINGGHHQATIKIGDDVLIGPNVCIYAYNHNFENLEIPIKLQGYYEADVIIEEDVWIGSNSVILPGVKIGKGSIIGAGSVVTKNIPPFTIAAGCPAKVIKKREN